MLALCSDKRIDDAYRSYCRDIFHLRGRSLLFTPRKFRITVWRSDNIVICRRCSNCASPSRIVSRRTRHLRVSGSLDPVQGSGIPSLLMIRMTVGKQPYLRERGKKISQTFLEDPPPQIRIQKNFFRNFHARVVESLQHPESSDSHSIGSSKFPKLSLHEN